MRNIQEIITDLRSTLEWSQPNVRYNEFLSLINELESTQSTSEQGIKPTAVEVESKPKTTTKKSTKTEE
jgi:hypothetical protein